MNEELGGELGFKRVEDILDSVGDFFHGGENWESLYSHTPLTKLYLDCQLGIHGHFVSRYRLRNLGFSEPCSVYEWDILLHGASLQAETRQILTTRDNKTEFTSCSTNQLERTVFVRNIELVQEPKRTEPVLVPSFIRLQPLQLGNMAAGKLFQEAFLGGLPETRPPKEHGKLTLPGINTAIESYELPDEAVEGRLEVMGDFAEDDSPHGVNVVHDLYPCDIPSRLLLGIHHDAIGFTLMEPLDRIVQSIELISCPSEFETWASKRTHKLDYILCDASCLHGNQR